MKPSASSRIIRAAIAGIGMVIVLFLLYLSLISTSYITSGSSEKSYLLKDSPAALLLIMAAVMTGLILMRRAVPLQKAARRINESQRLFHMLQAILFGVIAAGSLYWIFSVQAVPGADQKSMLTIAEQLLSGNTSAFAKNGYISIFPHQAGFALAVTLIAKVLGTDWHVFQIINIIGLLLAYWELSETAALLENRNTIRLAVLLACLLFYPLQMYVTFVYGTIWSYALALAAMRHELLFLKNGKAGSLALMSILIFLSVFLKSNSMILLIAMCIASLLEALQRRRWKPLLALAACIAMLAGEQLAVHEIISVLAGGNAAAGTSSWCYIAMDTSIDNSRAPGWYMSEFGPDLYLKSGAEAEEAIASAAAKQNINELLSSPAEAMSFFLEKNASQWNNPTFQGYWIVTTHNHASSTLLSVIGMLSSYGWLNVLQTLILAGAALFLLTCTGSSDSSELLYIAALIGGFLFHTFWEAKCQYTLPYFFLLIPLAIVGTSRFLQHPDALWRHSRARLILAAAILAATIIIWQPYAAAAESTDIQPAGVLAKTTQRMK